MMRNLVLLSASAVSLALAANNTYSGCLLSDPRYSASIGVSNFYFCSDNKCYDSNRSNLTCTNNYNKNELVKRTTTFTHPFDVTITKIEKDSVFITGMARTSEGW